MGAGDKDVDSRRSRGRRYRAADKGAGVAEERGRGGQERERRPLSRDQMRTAELTGERK